MKRVGARLSLNRNALIVLSVKTQPAEVMDIGRSSLHGAPFYSRGQPSKLQLPGRQVQLRGTLPHSGPHVMGVPLPQWTGPGRSS